MNNEQLTSAVALAYPEPERSGLFLGIWLSFRVSGQLLGGAINLGLNADRASAGAVNPKVFLVFVAPQAAGPFTSFLLPKPHRIQRRDNKPVQLYNKLTIAEEIRDTARLFIKKEVCSCPAALPQFLLITPLIVQGVFPEAFINTYIAHHFTVRVRALGSFTAACACVIIANIIGVRRSQYGLTSAVYRLAQPVIVDPCPCHFRTPHDTPGRVVDMDDGS